MMTTTTPDHVVPVQKLEARLPKGLRTTLLWLVVGAVAAWIVSLLPLDLGPIGKTTLSVFVFTIALWIGELVPTGIAAVIWAGLLILTLGKAMPAATIGSACSRPAWRRSHRCRTAPISA